MKHKQLKTISLVILSIWTTTLNAQESINATGGNAFGSGGSISYSVGQVNYVAKKGTSGTATQGVQQPFEISTISVIEDIKGINLIFTAYPNPTTDYLTLEVKSFQLSTLNFQMYDISGKLLQSEKITGNQTRIVMRNLVPSTYFVKVIQGNKEVKTFKIIKS